MTVKELIETNDSIGDIEISIREHGSGQLLAGLRIGTQYGEKPYHVDNEPFNKYEYIQKPINTIETSGRCYSLMMNRIPKKYLDLQVHGWICYQGYRIEDKHTTCDGLNTLVINVYPEWYQEIVSVAETKQLEGQMSIEDLEV